MPVPLSSHSGPEDCQQGIVGNQFKTVTHSIWTCKDKKVFEVTNISGIKSLDKRHAKYQQCFQEVGVQEEQTD